MTPKSYDQVAAKFLTVVGGNMPELPRHVLLCWIENPKALQNALHNALCQPVQDNCATARRLQPQFALWKTIKLGTYKSSDDLTSALQIGGFRIGLDAARTLKEFSIASAITKVDIVNVSVGELNFPRGATRAQIFAHATKFGLEFVPAEVGPQLRLQHPNQPYERLLIGMRPVVNSDGEPIIFGVGHDLAGRWLCTHYGYPDFFWGPEDRWVFARRKRG